MSYDLRCHAAEAGVLLPTVQAAREPSPRVLAGQRMIATVLLAAACVIATPDTTGRTWTPTGGWQPAFDPTLLVWDPPVSGWDAAPGVGRTEWLTMEWRTVGLVESIHDFGWIEGRTVECRSRCSTTWVDDACDGLVDWTCPRRMPLLAVGDPISGTLYRYRLRGCNSAGCSGPSNVVENCAPLWYVPLE